MKLNRNVNIKHYIDIQFDLHIKRSRKQLSTLTVLRDSYEFNV